MNLFKSWLKRNYFGVLVLILIIVALLDIATRYWFWSGLHLKFDASNFNNIFTPIGTIISTVLFFAALALAIKQNRIILSESLKSHFELEFDRIRKVLQCDLRMENVRSELYKLTRNAEYRNDLRDFRKGKIQNIGYFSDRDYCHLLESIYYSYIFQGLTVLDLVKGLIEDIELSNLQTEDQRFYKKRIKNEFVQSYLAFIEDCNQIPNRFFIPLKDDVKSEDQAVQFVAFHETNFNRHYKYFKEKLE